ncbi:MAG: hypothetical protein R3C28_28540 [Pirellulaceae bacterium]
MTFLSEDLPPATAVHDETEFGDPSRPELVDGIDLHFSSLRYQAWMA